MPTTPLEDEEVYDALKTLNGWESQDNGLIKTYDLPTYLAGLAFASAIGTLAEAHNHHPDLYIGYKKVRVELMTHDAGNRISNHDVMLARAIEGLRYPKP
jgi:4a-hydroxytetrahydrobiopterin dehydratase